MGFSVEAAVDTGALTPASDADCLRRWPNESVVENSSSGECSSGRRPCSGSAPVEDTEGDSDAARRLIGA